MIRTTVLPQSLRLGSLVIEVDSHTAWRDAARRLLTKRVAPDSVHWLDRTGERQLLLGMHSEVESSEGDLPAFQVADRSSAGRKPGANRLGEPRETAIRVPKRFTELARVVASHRDSDRWDLLYRVLWRLTHGERALLEDEADAEVRLLVQMEREVRADVEATKSAVRFHCVGSGADGHYVAWHRPAHQVLAWIVPYFRRRFGVMRWSVFTPDASVHWDGERLRWGPGAAEPPAVIGRATNDEIRRWWDESGKTLVLGSDAHADRSQHFALANGPLLAGQLPEKSEIRWTTDPPRRRAALAKSAEEYLPVDLANLQSLADAAAKCEGCPLYRNATQTVFGQGPANASIVFVGEQPGDVEDRRGSPFVGAAGKLLDEVLEEVGIDRGEIYLTNAVKHFKWTPRGKRRLPAKPTSREAVACRPWLEAELLAIKPKVLVCLGATAVGALLGPDHRVTRERGRIFASNWAPKTIVTWHPSAVLRAVGADPSARLRAQFVADLQKVARLLKPKQSARSSSRRERGTVARRGAGLGLSRGRGASQRGESSHDGD